MRRLEISIFLIFLFSSSFVLGQTENESIVYQNTGLGTVFMQGERILKPKELVTITENQPEANTFMKKAKTNNDWATVFGIIGGGLVGWPIGTALGGGEPNWTLAGIGAGFIVVSIPLSSGFKKNAIRGAERFNQSLGETSHRSIEWNLTLSEAGMGIKLKF